MDQNHGLTPLEKCLFLFTFWTSCFYSLQIRFYVLEYHKRHFAGLNCLKKKVGKMAISWLKPCVNPFGKFFFFFTFWTSCFYSLQRRFYVLEYHKRHFPGLNCLKKRFEKCPFLDQNHGSCQFFDFLNFLFWWPRKAVLRSRIS